VSGSNPLVAEDLHHVSLSVTDLDRAKRFYSDVLGLNEVPRPAFDFPGAWYVVGDRQLHLIVHTTPRTLRGTTEIDGRDGHFAMRVEDYDAALEHLRAHGVEVRERPTNPTPWAQLYVTDPDGNVIELNTERDG
jgi:catechol 2,3-dioxygenase-like lactoylglutathione lyase family enzyme